MHLQDYNSAQCEVHLHLWEDEGDDGAAGSLKHSTEDEPMFSALQRLHPVLLILFDLFLQCLHLHTCPSTCVSLSSSTFSTST